MGDPKVACVVYSFLLCCILSGHRALFDDRLLSASERDNLVILSSAMRAAEPRSGSLIWALGSDRLCQAPVAITEPKPNVFSVRLAL